MAKLYLFFGYIFLNIAQYPMEIEIIAYIMLVFMFLQSFTELYYSIFRAFERMHYDAFLRVLRMLILASMIIYLLKNGYGLFECALAFVTTELIVLIIASFIVYSRFVKFSLRFDYGFSLKLIKWSSLFCLSLIFSKLSFCFISH